MARIVVVEDDPLVSELIVDALEERDHELSAFASSTAAYEGMLGLEPDLLVCDVDLPDGTGLDLITRVRKLHPELPVLIQSGRDEECDLLAGFAAGANDYITKPISVHELQAKCAVMLAKALKPVPAAGHDLPGGTESAFGRYRITGILGAGGFGTVYAARDLDAEHDVALKVLPALAGLDDATRQRFVREAYALSLVEHPNLARIHDFGTLEGRSYYAMQRIDGPTLREHIEQHGPLDEARLLTLFRVLLDVVAAVHARGLVHRDLKPANVVLRNHSLADPVLIDFGLAKHPGDRTVTKTGEVLGSPHYLPPEQILSKPLTHRCDQFALGLLMRFAYVGGDVWADRDLMSLLRTLVSQPVPFPPTISDPLRAILRRMTRVDAGQRYASLSEVCSALDTLGEG